MSANKLHSGLVEDGNYSKSLPDFLNDYSTPEKQKTLHDGLVEDGEYSGDFNSFQNQYFSKTETNKELNIPTPADKLNIAAGEFFNSDAYKNKEQDKKLKIQEAALWIENNEVDYNYSSKSGFFIRKDNSFVHVEDEDYDQLMLGTLKDFDLFTKVKENDKYRASKKQTTLLNTEIDKFIVNYRHNANLYANPGLIDAYMPTDAGQSGQSYLANIPVLLDSNISLGGDNESQAAKQEITNQVIDEVGEENWIEMSDDEQQEYIKNYKKENQKVKNQFGEKSLDLNIIRDRSTGYFDDVRGESTFEELWNKAKTIIAENKKIPFFDVDNSDADLEEVFKRLAVASEADGVYDENITNAAIEASSEDEGYYYQDGADEERRNLILDPLKPNDLRKILAFSLEGEANKVMTNHQKVADNLTKTFGVVTELSSKNSVTGKKVTKLNEEIKVLAKGKYYDQESVDEAQKLINAKVNELKRYKSQYDKAYSMYEKAFNSYKKDDVKNQIIVETAQGFKDFQNEYKKDHGIFSKAEKNLYVNTVGLVAAIENTVYKSLGTGFGLYEGSPGGLLYDGQKKFEDNIRDVQNKVQEQIGNTSTYDEVVEGWYSLADYTINTTAQAAPLIATLVLTKNPKVASALMYSYGAGDKYYEMDQEIAKWKDLNPELADKKYGEYSALSYHGIPFLSGSATALSERFTFNQARKLAGSMKSKGPLFNGMLNSFKQQLKPKSLIQGAKYSLGEAGTEWGDGVAQNVIKIHLQDDDSIGHIFQGTDHDFVTGFTVSTMLFRLPTVTMNMFKGYKSGNSQRMTDNFTKRQLEITTLLNSNKLSKPMEAQLHKEFAALTVKTHDLLRRDISNLNYFSRKEKETLTNVEVEKSKLRVALKDLQENSKLDNNANKKEEQKLKEQYFELDNVKENLINAYNNAYEVKKEGEVNSKNVKKQSEEIFGDKIEIIQATSPENSAELIELSLQERKIAILEQYTRQNSPLTKDAQNEINQINEDLAKIQDINKLPGQKSLAGGALTAYGYITPKDQAGRQKIIVNKKAALKDGFVTTEQHEFLHAVTYETLKNDPKIQKAVGEALSGYIESITKESLAGSELAERMKGYTFDEGVFNEEKLNLLSEAMVRENLPFKKESFEKVKDVTRRFFQNYLGKDIQFNTGKDVYNFIKDYNNSVKTGNFSKAITKMAREGASGTLVDGVNPKTNQVKMSKTAKDKVKQTLDDIGKEEKYDPVNDQAQNKRIAEQLPSMVKVQVDNYFNNRPSLKADQNVRNEVIAETLFGLINVTKNNRSDITGFDPLINNSLYGYLNGRIKYRMLDTFKNNPTIVPDFTKADFDEATKFLTTDDIVTTKKTKSVKTKLVQTKSRQLTNLADLDIESSPLIKQATKVELKKLIESNPKNIVQEIQNVLIPDLVEITRQEMGVVGQVKGKLNIPETYNAYLSDTYQKTISSMEILKIRTNYKNLFKKEKMGFADYATKKSDKPSLKKDSNYIKDINRNTTTKAEFIKYHTEGKKNKLIANQRNLALMRVEAEVVRAADNYIVENSSNLDQVYAAELRNFIDSKTVEKQQKENKSFDSVKFSLQAKKYALDQIFLFNEISKQGYGKVFSSKGNLLPKYNNRKIESESVEFAKELYHKGLVIPSNALVLDKSKAYSKALSLIIGKVGSRARSNIYEWIPINIALEIGKPYGLEMLTPRPAEGGLPDFHGALHGFDLFIEGKLFDAQHGSATIEKANLTTGTMKILNDYEFNPILEEMWEGNVSNIKDYASIVLDLMKEKGIKISEVLNNTLIPEEIFLQLGASGLNIQKTVTVEKLMVGRAGDVVGELYAKKKLKDGTPVPNYYINILGKGLRWLSKNIYEFDVPKFEGDINMIMRAVAASSTPKKAPKGYESYHKPGMKYYALNIRFVPIVDMRSVKGESKYSIDNKAEMLALLKSDAALAMKAKREKLNAVKLNKAVMASRTAKEPKGITVLDFDDTLATSNSLIRYTRPDGEEGTLTPEQYASTYQDLQDLGYDFDFSEFNKVVDGKIAPLFQKALKLQGKFGPENMFVLTARPAESAPAIFAFIKANGLNIPLKNITGLANSTSEAKALWIADKVSEGYNDFYFADDALQNVQAVDNMLNQFDVKRKVQQAKIKFSKSMDTDFNDILENITGIESKKRFGFIKARKRGASKGKFRFFIPPSHEDFVGLLYNFIGKGKEGNKHRNFFEQALVRPLNRANKEYDTARQSVATDYKNLNKQMPDVKKKLIKKTPDGDFTYQDAIRVNLWDKHGYNIPGLSEVDQAKLVKLVKSDAALQSYAETINTISKQETYVNPTDGWDSGDIRMDLDDATGRIGRAQFFEEFSKNADIIFSKENLNKIEAGYGKGVREALEDMLYRIKTGRNKPTGQNKMVNALMNWINGSVGSVMFFNMRSALLQQMSIVNYINFADNNVFAAAKAFANQKQYWNDWSFIFNSDMLKQRRGGIMTDVNGAELAADMRKSKNPHRFLISKLLELGFLPTQIGDNIAIATGGASYYRNRINKYIKEGLSQKEAEAKAFTDFQDITQSTQQSARPDMVSQQQASIIGKVILNFQNVTSQFNRLGKKAFLDIKNRRITGPNKTQMQSDISNAARITYYFAVQNIIFYTLQTAMFAMMFDDDEEDNNKLFLKKKERLINGSIDSVLRGSGILGGVISTLKNVAIAFARQRDVNYNPDESAVVVEALNFSPVLGIKARKIVNAEKTLNYNKKVIKEMETFEIDNPQWSAVTNYVEGFTNLPLNRLYNKTQNVRQGLSNEHAAWERSLLFLGWSQYNLDLENEKMDAIKEKISKKTSKKTGKSKFGKGGFGGKKTKSKFGKGGFNK